VVGDGVVAVAVGKIVGVKVGSAVISDGEGVSADVQAVTKTTARMSTVI